MTRRGFLVAATSACLPQNEFQCAYNAWAERANARPEGTIDAREMQLWVEVKRAWRKFQGEVDRYYRI